MKQKWHYVVKLAKTTVYNELKKGIEAKFFKNHHTCHQKRHT